MPSRKPLKINLPLQTAAGKPVILTSLTLVFRIQLVALDLFNLLGMALGVRRHHQQPLVRVNRAGGTLEAVAPQVKLRVPDKLHGVFPPLGKFQLRFVAVRKPVFRDQLLGSFGFLRAISDLAENHAVHGFRVWQRLLIGQRFAFVKSFLKDVEEKFFGKNEVLDYLEDRPAGGIWLKTRLLRADAFKNDGEQARTLLELLHQGSTVFF